MKGQTDHLTGTARGSLEVHPECQRRGSYRGVFADPDEVRATDPLTPLVGCNRAAQGRPGRHRGQTDSGPLTPLGVRGRDDPGQWRNP